MIAVQKNVSAVQRPSFYRCGVSLSGFATVAGNEVMLWLFYRNESLRTTFNGQLPLLSALHYSIYMLWIHTTTATTFHLCCVSVDRFIANRFPFRYQDIVTKKRCCKVIILVWLISLDPWGNIASAVLWLSLAFVTFIASLFVVTFCLKLHDVNAEGCFPAKIVKASK